MKMYKMGLQIRKDRAVVRWVNRVRIVAVVRGQSVVPLCGHLSTSWDFDNCC